MCEDGVPSCLSYRNIWDGSLAVEKSISKGNQTVSIVSIRTRHHVSVQQLFELHDGSHHLTLFLPPPQLESSVGLFELESVLLELCGLREFLDKNSQFSPSSLGAAR